MHFHRPAVSFYNSRSSSSRKFSGLLCFSTTEQSLWTSPFPISRLPGELSIQASLLNFLWLIGKIKLKQFLACLILAPNFQTWSGNTLLLLRPPLGLFWTLSFPFIGSRQHHSTTKYPNLIFIVRPKNWPLANCLYPEEETNI